LQSKSTIIVTGANGFIGSCLVADLTKNKTFNDSEIIAVDLVGPEVRDFPLAALKVTKFIKHDQLWDLLDQRKDSVSWVFHMGANSSTTETNKSLLWDLNTLYTQKLFNWCAQNNKGLIYASSGATYGAGEKGYDDSTDSELLKPLNLYGESKVAVDRWVKTQQARPKNWYGLKFFNVFGPNEYHKGSMSSVIFKSFNQIKKTGKVQLFKSYKSQYSDGGQMRDFVYVKDITRWMIEIAIKKPESGIYNMGFGKARTWKDLAQGVFNSMKLKDNIQYIDMPSELKDQYQYFTEAKMTKLFSAGISKPEWPLELAIQDYVQNYLEGESCRYMSS
jgi:ADP-L-glycero-D-manno-heptose 6-epimerase